MRPDLSFEREHVVDVDAAVVGISRHRWAALTSEDAADLDRARSIMDANGFDVMPVVDASGDVQSYVATETWGDYSGTLIQRPIDANDTIPQRTPLEEILRGFAEDGRDFYFLSSYGRLTGLVSLTNLNCRQARVFLYGLVSEVEGALGDLVQQAIDGGTLTDAAVLAEAKPSVAEAYDEAKSGGVNPKVVEFLYLSDLAKVVRKHDLFGPLGYPSRKRFETDFKRLVQMRNRVAHPLRGLIEARKDVGSLWRDVLVCERSLSALRQSGHSESS